MIRPARLEDAAAITVIWNRIIRETTVTFTTDEKTQEEIADALTKQPFLLAETDGHTEGFATYGPFRKGPGYAQTMEHSIHLADAARGQGLGRALMGELEEHARDACIHSLIAGIGGENPGAVAFHTALGFQQVGHIRQAGRKFGRWQDLILMQKYL